MSIITTITRVAAITAIVLPIPVGTANAEAPGGSLNGSNPGELWATQGPCMFIVTNQSTVTYQLVQMYPYGSWNQPEQCRAEARFTFVDKADSSKASTVVMETTGNETGMWTLDTQRVYLQRKELTVWDPQGGSHYETDLLGECLWTGDGTCQF